MLCLGTVKSRVCYVKGLLYLEFTMSVIVCIEFVISGVYLSRIGYGPQKVSRLGFERKLIFLSNVNGIFFK